MCPLESDAVGVVTRLHVKDQRTSSTARVHAQTLVLRNVEAHSLAVRSHAEIFMIVTEDVESRRPFHGCKPGRQKRVADHFVGKPPTRWGMGHQQVQAFGKVLPKPSTVLGGSLEGPRIIPLPLGLQARRCDR